MSGFVDPLIAEPIPEAAPAAPETFANSGAGQALTGLLGAARTASLGSTDVLLTEGANLVAGRGARQAVARGLSSLKEANPYTDLAGETAGMLLGGGLSEVGAAAEGALGASAGEGLLGRLLTHGVRGAAEGALIGAQHSISEESLGDHALHGEALFATMGKDALIGGAFSAGLGLAGAGVKRAFGIGASAADAPVSLDGILGARGARPYRDAALDDVAGLKGAGAGLRESAAAAEGTIESLRRTGLTAEEATTMVDGLNRAASNLERAKGDAPGLVDRLRDEYISQVAGSPERAAIMRRGYDIEAGLRASHEDTIRNTAAELSKGLTKVFRSFEDTANEAQFGMKPSTMARLTKGVDPSTSRDVAVKAFRHVEGVLEELNSLHDKGGASGPVKRLIGISADLSRVINDGSATAADHMLAVDQLNRAVGKFVPFELSPGARSYGQNKFFDVYHDLRGVLRDEGAWGPAGRAQADLNDAFSSTKARRDHAAQTVGQTIDRGETGQRLTSGDFQKMQGLLRSLTGDTTDAEIEGVKSVEAFVDGSRRRLAAVREHVDLDAGQIGKLNEGEAALNEFERQFATAKQEVSANNKLRSMQLVEREGRSIGGIIGAIGDVVSKPLTTLERIAEVRSVAERMQRHIKTGIEALTSGKTTGAKAGGGAASKSAAAAEIMRFRELLDQPEKLEGMVSQMSSKLRDVAPRTADELGGTARRALTFLAMEAPSPLSPRTTFGMGKDTPRFSDSQLEAWESKRNAALGSPDGRTAPEVIIEQMKSGRIDRDAIRTIEHVSPSLFRHIQWETQQQLSAMAAKGTLDDMTLARQGAIAALIKVPPSKLWEPEMMASLQPVRQDVPGPDGSNNRSLHGTSKRKVEVNSASYKTETQSIEEQ